MSTGVHVLHVAQPTDGGVARYVATLAADQASRGWRVAVACPDDGGLLPEALDDLRGLGVRRIPWAARRSPGPATLGETAALARIVRRERPDAVQLHSAKAGLAGRLALRGRLPTLFAPHGWSWLAAGRLLRGPTLMWERVGARWGDVCVCGGDGEAGLAVDAGVPGPRVVVRNGVDLARFRPADDAGRTAARSALGLDPAAPTVVCLGRVCRQKGQDLLLRAWPGVRAAVPDARLLVVGGDRSLADPTVAGVEHVAAVPDVRPWLAGADVVAFPSRWEGLSLTLLEALAVGRPVVASDIAGLAEAVGDGTGARVGCGDTAALADALRRRLVDADLCRREGAAAARSAGAFDARDTLEGVARITAQLVDERRASTAVRRGPHVDD